MLTTSVERLEDNKVKLTVSIPAEQVDTAIDAAYRKLGGKVKVPGFRPGHVPRKVLNNVLGEANIMAEATEELVNTTYPRALDAESLRPVEPPVMEEMETVAAGEDYTFEAEIEVRPELVLSSTKDIAIELPPREATDEEIQLQIDMARDRFATLEPVEDRGVQADDYVLISFTGTVDGEIYEGNVVDKYLYEMGRGLMPTEFDDGLVGAKPGDEVKIEFDIPETSANPDFVGKMAGFEISVHEIKVKILPEVDDEFATNAGGFDSVDDMRDNIRERIETQKNVTWDQLRERTAREELTKRLEGDIPEQMVRSRQNQMERDFMTMLEQREMSMADYLSSNQMGLEDFTAQMAEQAEQSVREELAMEALFRELEMEITEEDIDAEVQMISQSSDETPEEARKRWEDLGLMSVITEQIMHRKAIMWLLDNMTVTEVEPEAADAEGAESDAGDEAVAANSDSDTDADDAEPEASEE